MRPGALLKRAFGLADMMRSERDTGDSAAYLAKLRDCPCLKCGMDPAGEAAHVRQQSGSFNKRGGTGKKPADKWALPLCRACHLLDQDSQHNIGELAFWYFVGINPLLICQRLWAQRDDLMAMRAVIFGTIAERTRGQ